MSTKKSERAIVSGATSGIGRAVAVRLAARGAIVGLIGRNHKAAEQVAREVVSNAQEVQDAVRNFVAQHGGVNTVVASAGIALTGRVTDCKLSDWDRIMATNLNGAFYLARFAIPELLKSRGTFTAISSDAGHQGACDYSAYCASKHALNGLIKCLALDYGSQGVRCNAVCPGFVDTPMAEQLLKDATAAEVSYFKRIVPLGRFARPEEVAAAVAHLSSDEASYVNGMIYKLDGGTSAGFYSAGG
jgi:NAD(P)-dependent dehydrogenase (short-subunit alcohol dehydrogenase family)